MSHAWQRKKTLNHPIFIGNSRFFIDLHDKITVQILMRTVRLCVHLICDFWITFQPDLRTSEFTFLLYCYLYIIQLCIYHHFQGISLSSLLTISGVPQIFKLGNIFEHLLLDFNFIFSYLGNSFYKVGEYFCSPTL